MLKLFGFLWRRSKSFRFFVAVIKEARVPFSVEFNEFRIEVSRVNCSYGVSPAGHVLVGNGQSHWSVVLFLVQVKQLWRWCFRTCLQLGDLFRVKCFIVKNLPLLECTFVHVHLLLPDSVCSNKVLNHGLKVDKHVLVARLPAKSSRITLSPLHLHLIIVVIQVQVPGCVVSLQLSIDLWLIFECFPDLCPFLLLSLFFITLIHFDPSCIAGELFSQYSSILAIIGIKNWKWRDVDLNIFSISDLLLYLLDVVVTVSVGCLVVCLIQVRVINLWVGRWTWSGVSVPQLRRWLVILVTLQVKGQLKRSP